MSKLLKRLNDNQNKVADTNGIMKLQAWDDGVAQDLTGKTIQATVANASGFLFDLDLVSNGTEIDLDFKDSKLQKLTPDTYFLEIKVTDETGDVSVYPTEGYATFTINKNLHATEGALVPQITFDTVLADVKKAMDEKVANYTRTIAKGEKGDPGKDADIPVVGGRNYVQNSSGLNGSSIVRPTLIGASSGGANTTITYLSDGILMTNDATNTTKEWYYQVASAWTSFGNDIRNDGTPYTFSAEVKGTAKQVALRASYNGTNPYSVINYANINENSWTKLSVNISFPLNSTGLFFRIQGAINNQVFNGWTGGEYIKFRYVKIEAGNVPTDWTTAPEDIQSDISKRAIDTSVVHNTGNETIAGNKTLTGSVKGGQVNLPDSGDLNTLTETGKYYQTTSANTANWANRPSNAPSLAFSVDVIGQANGTLATQVYFVHQNSRMWVRTIWVDGTIKSSPWVELANDSSVVHNTGNNIVVANNTYMGTNTFMDGVSLNGKNVVNDLTDTDWLDIPLAAGRTGTAKYKVSLGKMFVHIDNIKGVTAAGNNEQGKLCTLPVNPSPFYTRHIVPVGNTSRVLNLAPNGVLYLVSSMGSTVNETDSYNVDFIVM